MTALHPLHRTDTQPLALADHGCFFVGGRYVEREGETFHEGGMYVEYFTPLDRRHTAPVVMFHGGGQTGTNFLGTPDGRRGWVHDFLLAGYAVYVVDQPERGRSGHLADTQGRYSLIRYSVQRIEQRFTASAQSLLWPQASLHVRWPGTGQRGDPVFDQFFRSQIQMVTDRVAMERMLQQAGSELLQDIGPAVLLTHSQSGPFGWLLADACPDKVAAIIAVEPNGPPFFDVDLLGTESDQRTLRFGYEQTPSRGYGIAHAPLRFSPELGVDHRPAYVFDKQRSAADRVPGYLQAQPARRLPALAGIPILMLTAESSYHVTYDHLTSRFLNQAGVAHEHVYLSEQGIHGNGHMVMLEENNHDIADLLIDWLATRLTTSR